MHSDFYVYAQNHVEFQDKCTDLHTFLRSH